VEHFLQILFRECSPWERSP